MARRSTNYPRELRDRTVRMVAQMRPEYPPDWPAICAVAEKLGIGTAANAAAVVPETGRRSQGEYRYMTL